MTEIQKLIDRVDHEFSVSEEKIKNFQKEQIQAYHERQQRLQKLSGIFEDLRKVWGPRLEVLTKKFGDKVQVRPNLVPSLREANFEFQSKLAKISLKFSASTNSDVTKIILNYDLRIVPALMEFESHSQMEFPIDSPDPESIAQWIEDRIVSFVRTYQSLHENEYYLKEQMVEDPVIGIRFPKFAAGATLEWKGSTYFFINEETRREFQKQREVKSS